MKEKPLNPKLPGRYGKMTKRQLDAMVAQLEQPIPLSETRSLTSSERVQWARAKRRPGRPRRGKGARVISLSVEQSLLERADHAAQRSGMSRAALFEIALRAMLDNIKRVAG